MLYNKALLYISLPTLKSYNNFHQELIRSIIINNVTDGLTIYISSPKFENYSKTSPISSWNEINDFLNAVYICGSKIAYEIEKYFIDIVVIFENWCGYQVELGKDFQAFFGSFHEKNVLEGFNENRKNSNLIELPIHFIKSNSSPQLSPPPQQTGIIKNGDDNKSLGKTIYQSVAVGGTFDHLHAGHKIMLTMTAWISQKKITCGVTAENMLKNKKYKEFLESTEVRIEKVTKFLNSIRCCLEYKVVPLYDIYGPTVITPEIQALVVSKETLSNGEIINEERKKIHLEPLDILVIEVISPSSSSLKDDELNLKLSSTHIRELLSKKNSSI
nr:2163_t:CDS:2 [Entrophospora candida]